MHQWHIYSDNGQLAQALGDFLIEAVTQVLQEQPRCNIALPGGNTPAPILASLAKQNLPWEQIHWYLGDERCYPINHAERNDTMIRQMLWSQLPVSDEHFHPIPTELGPEQAAELYSEDIRRSGGMDIVFLGMGEDGHTASLFPGNPALEKTEPAVPVYQSPKPPDERVSLSIPTLSQAAFKIVLTTGVGKYPAIKQIKAGETLPINCIGDLHWFVDEAAVNG